MSGPSFILLEVNVGSRSMKNRLAVKKRRPLVGVVYVFGVLLTIGNERPGILHSLRVSRTHSEQRTAQQSGPV